jgi:hypothetical protein
MLAYAGVCWRMLAYADICAYKQLSAHFPDSVVLGWTNGEKLILNPPPDATLPAGAVR